MIQQSFDEIINNELKNIFDPSISNLRLNFLKIHTCCENCKEVVISLHINSKDKNSDQSLDSNNIDTKLPKKRGRPSKKKQESITNDDSTNTNSKDNKIDSNFMDTENPNRSILQDTTQFNENKSEKPSVSKTEEAFKKIEYASYPDDNQDEDDDWLNDDEHCKEIDEFLKEVNVHEDKKIE